MRWWPPRSRRLSTAVKPAGGQQLAHRLGLIITMLQQPAAGLQMPGLRSMIWRISSSPSTPATSAPRVRSAHRPRPDGGRPRQYGRLLRIRSKRSPARPSNQLLWRNSALPEGEALAIALGQRHRLGDAIHTRHLPAAALTGQGQGDGAAAGAQVSTRCGGGASCRAVSTSSSVSGCAANSRSGLQAPATGMKYRPPIRRRSSRAAKGCSPGSPARCAGAADCPGTAASSSFTSSRAVGGWVAGAVGPGAQDGGHVGTPFMPSRA